MREVTSGWTYTTNRGREMAILHIKESKVIGNRVKDAAGVHGFLKEHLANLDQESFWVIGLDTEHKIILCELLFLGGMSCSVVDPKILFRRLLIGECAAFIVAHNHPSGNPTPSSEDVFLTQRIKQGAEILDLKFLDHLLIAGDHVVRVQ